MKTTLTKLILPAKGIFLAAFLTVLAPAEAGHDKRVVTRDRSGNPVYSYQYQHCGTHGNHRSHWYDTPRSSHDHYCPGGTHQHRSSSGGRRIRY